MQQYFQINIGSIAALIVVALFVFLAIRRLVLDKKAGIGACGQKCSQCAKMGHCEQEKAQEPIPSCTGSCAGCKYSASCHKQ